MATTTTFAAIRGTFLPLVRAITPTKLANRTFEATPLKSKTLRAFAESAPTEDKLRKYDWRVDGDEAEPFILDATAKEIDVGTIFTVAYPVLLGLYGTEDLYDLEDTMESDQRQIFKVFRNSANYVAGLSNAAVSVRPPDRANERVWFAEFSIVLTYTAAGYIS